MPTDPKSAKPRRLRREAIRPRLRHLSVEDDWLHIWQILGRSGDSFAYAAIPVVAEA